VRARRCGEDAPHNPLLVERLAPDRARRPGRLAQGVTVLGMTGFAAFGVTGIVIAYTA
jgi:hypothetical protein